MRSSRARSRCSPSRLHLPDDRAGVHGIERRRALDQDPCRGSRALRRARPARSRRFMSERQAFCTPDIPAATASIRTWAGFLLMCLGMFMAILDVQIVATSLPTIQHELENLAGRDELDPDRVSDRGGDRDSSHRPVNACPQSCDGCSLVAVASFTLASIGCAFSWHADRTLLIFRVAQGFAGGVLIPAVFSAVFLLFPPRLHAARHHHRRRHRGAGADDWSHRRWLDHRQLVVAVAVPDQCRSPASSQPS